MPCLRQTSRMVKPRATSRSTSRRKWRICCESFRLLMSPSLDHPRGTVISCGPTFREPTTEDALGQAVPVHHGLLPAQLPAEPPPLGPRVSHLRSLVLVGARTDLAEPV